jgi:protein involved in polysaccharide export with SLBB domain
MYNTVTLAGFVRNPGEYELKAGMKISSLIRPDALLPEAYLDRIEVVRLKPDWTREVIAVNGRGVLQLDIGQDIELKPLDKITVGSEARGPIRVMLKGEFKVPGVYTTSQGERLSSVIARAGGYTDRAYVRGALFLRESVRKTQKEKLDVFVKSTEARLLAEASSYEAAGLSRDESAAEKESLNQRREMVRLVAQQVVPGRVVVRLDEPQKMQGGPYDIELEDGDTVEVPKTPASVLVVGSVRVPTAVTWQKGQNVDYYIDQSGGLAKEADQSEIHVIKPDGTAVASFVRVRDVEPGDVVVVPPETETKVRTRSVIKDIAQIVASMAFAAAGFAAVLR